MFNFIKFANDHHIHTVSQGHHHCSNGWIQTHCPTCTNGRDGYHLGFNLDRGYFSCWRCGKAKIVEIIQRFTRLPLNKAWALRWEYDDEQKKRAPHTPILRPRSVEPPPGLEVLSDRHLAYLNKTRGLKDVASVVETWQLVGTGRLSGKWAWRVVAPVYNKKSHIVAYVGRSIVETKTKYRMTEREKCGTNPDGLLYGIHKAEGDSVLIVEGPGDVWRLGPGAVATFGIEWREKQANQLRHFKRRFILYDPEEKAQKQAQKLAEWLSLFPGDTEIISGLPSDPGSLSEREVRKIRKELLG